VLGQIVGMGHALEVPHVDGLVGCLDDLTRQLIFQGVLRREHRVLYRPGPGTRRTEHHLRSAVGTADAGGSWPGWEPP